MVKIDVPLSKLSQNWNCITFWTTLYVAIEYIVANLLLIAYVKHGTSKANSLPNRPICPKQACHPWSNELKWLSKVTVGNSLSASVVDSFTWHKVQQCVCTVQYIFAVFAIVLCGNISGQVDFLLTLFYAFFSFFVLSVRRKTITNVSFKLKSAPRTHQSFCHLLNKTKSLSVFVCITGMCLQ